MKNLFLLACLFIATNVFAVNVETQKSTNQETNVNTQTSIKNLPQATTPTKEQLNWKERKALKILNKKIKKAQKKQADMGGLFYTVGIIIVVLGLVGLIIGGTLGTIGIGGILVGLILVLLGKFL